MGVINMAHGEFMTIGAYTIFLASTLTERLAPSFMPYYFLIAIGVAFVFAFIVGWFVEWSLIRHLYKRPLDTLLATWGISLAMQQCFRAIFVFYSLSDFVFFVFFVFGAFVFFNFLITLVNPVFRYVIVNAPVMVLLEFDEFLNDCNLVEIHCLNSHYV
jgi:branched-subunit amino acid ABC-type transport system permease component